MILVVITKEVIQMVITMEVIMLLVTMQAILVHMDTCQITPMEDIHHNMVSKAMIPRLMEWLRLVNNVGMFW